MLTTALILFIIAALGGMFLLTYVLLGKNTPKSIAILHGSIASVALILLMITAFIGKSILWFNVGFFIIVALGGIYLFTRDILGKKIPKAIGILHGTLALIGIIFLASVMYYYF